MKSYINSQCKEYYIIDFDSFVCESERDLIEWTTYDCTEYYGFHTYTEGYVTFTKPNAMYTKNFKIISEVHIMYVNDYDISGNKNIIFIVNEWEIINPEQCPEYKLYEEQNFI